MEILDEHKIYVVYTLTVIFCHHVNNVNNMNILRFKELFLKK